MLRIGYQGDLYSNNEYVTKVLFPDDKHIPLIKSVNVADALVNGTIDYGIMALYNSIGGQVQETHDVLTDNQLILKNTYGLQIRHYLFSTGIDIQNIREIWSHPQALKQTALWRKDNIPFAKEIAVDDQAKAAREVSKLNRADIAVLCRYEAGVAYGLNLLYKDGISDIQNNITIFGVFKY